MRVICFTLCTWVLIASCNEARREHVSPELRPSAGATKLKHTRAEGFERIDDIVNQPFPPRTLINQLCSRVAARGWRPLAENAFNPQDKSAYAEGWRKRVVAYGATAPRRLAYIWWSQWQRDDGAVLDLSLSYLYPRDAPPDLRTLYVGSAIASASRVNQFGIRLTNLHRLPVESRPMTRLLRLRLPTPESGGSHLRTSSSHNPTPPVVATRSVSWGCIWKST